MFLPIRTDSPLRTTPYVNWVLIALNVLVFALQQASPWKSQFYMLSPREPHLLSYFTYQFLHGSILHLFSNMLFLFIFAQDLEFNFAGGDSVAHMAHIAGTVFGFAVCLGLLAVRLLPRDQFDVVALIQRWNKRRQYRDMVARGFDPFGYAPRQDA